MRVVTSSLVAMVSAGMGSTASAAVTAASGVTASANGWDARIEGYGCVPSGCVAANAIDDSIEPASRWSCKAMLTGGDACELTLALDVPTDIVEVRIALYKGDLRTRTINILVDGTLASTIEASGTTVDYETYELIAVQASTVVLQSSGLEDNGWLSTTGVQLMMDSEVDSSPPPAPTGDDYVGCFNDMVSDRVMTNVMTSDALTPEACAATCAEMGDRFYGLQAGNECWCSGCDLTDNDTNTSYDRHGAGTCSVACTGDATFTCGGDMAISLYQTGTCTITPAPTPSISDSECPSGSIQSSLEITLTWETNDDLDLHVEEPGGEEVSYVTRLGDVGMMSNDVSSGPGSETFILLNGLSVTDDDVLGDYEVWVTNGDVDTAWVLTARSGGKLMWAFGGVVTDPDAESARYTATVTEYTESDCSIDAYGDCPAGAFSSNGLAPCTSCPSGDVSDAGATSCTLGALEDIDVSEQLAKAIVADAVGGFAGPGDINLDGGSSTTDRVLIGVEEAGTLELSGIFERDDNVALPGSTAVFAYIVDDDAQTFVQSQGDIDAATGGFTVMANDIPVGFSKAILSFAVINPADTPDEQGADSVFVLDVVNGGCNSPLTFTLKWDTDNSDLDLYVTEPNGNTISGGESGDFGYITDDVEDGFGPEIYTVFSGDASAVGQYSARVRARSPSTDTTWTLTARVNEVVVWDELGTYTPGDLSYGFSDGSSNSPTFFYTLAADSIVDSAC